MDKEIFFLPFVEGPDPDSHFDRGHIWPLFKKTLHFGFKSLKSSSPMAPE